MIGLLLSSIINSSIGGYLAKSIVEMLMKYATCTFISEVTILSLNAWAKTTDNKYDDEVVAAMAKAQGITLPN